MDLKEICMNGGNWVDSVQDRDYLRASGFHKSWSLLIHEAIDICFDNKCNVPRSRRAVSIRSVPVAAHDLNGCQHCSNVEERSLDITRKRGC